MTQEEKQLLLKDLCARLPYNEVRVTNGKRRTLILAPTSKIEEIIDGGYLPYLRPMSSMTTDEKMEWFQMRAKHCNMSGFNEIQERADFTSESLDWLNKNMFDYRGLIPMGLALEAKEGMYKTE